MEDQRKQRLLGVTLFELIITLAILSIGAAIAIPSFARLSKQTRVTAETNRLVGTLRMARQLAVQTGRRVVVCPLDATNQCTRDNWRNGWTVFRNTHREFPPALDPQDQVIRVYQQQRDTLTLKSKQDYLTFRPLGTATASTIQVCSGDDSVTRAVIVSRVGRVRAARETPDNKTPSCVDDP